VNQPLAAVVTNGNACSRWLAAEPPNLDEARLALERIVRDANRASQVVERVRGLARPGVPRRERIDLNDVVQEAIALTRSEVQQHRIALNSELADDLPLVLGDRVQLQQVLLNLMVNAIEALADADAPRLLGLRTTGGPGGVRVEVTDSGNGPDPRVADRLFEAFYTTKPGGMGMGLAISRSIIESHGGRIWATADGGGTAVRFELPAGAEAAKNRLTDGRGGRPHGVRPR
jgi:signal transduction histidine kinase